MSSYNILAYSLDRTFNEKEKQVFDSCGLKVDYVEGLEPLFEAMEAGLQGETTPVLVLLPGEEENPTELVDMIMSLDDFKGFSLAVLANADFEIKDTTKEFFKDPARLDIELDEEARASALSAFLEKFSGGGEEVEPAGSGSASAANEHSSKYQIICYSKMNKFFEGLRETIREASFKSQYINSLQDFIEAVANARKSELVPLLIVDSGSDMSRGDRLVNIVSMNEELHKLPILVVGKISDACLRDLNDSFSTTSLIAEDSESSLVLSTATELIKNDADIRFKPSEEKTETLETPPTSEDTSPEPKSTPDVSEDISSSTEEDFDIDALLDSTEPEAPEEEDFDIDALLDSTEPEAPEEEDFDIDALLDSTEPESADTSPIEPEAPEEEEDFDIDALLEANESEDLSPEPEAKEAASEQASMDEGLHPELETSESEIEELVEAAEQIEKAEGKYLDTLQSQASWESAFDIAGKISVPFNHSSKIRAVMIAAKQDKSKIELRDLAVGLTYPYLIRLSKSYKAIFYHASQDLYSVELGILNKKDLLNRMKLFTYDEICSIIAIVYLSSNFRKRFEPEDWDWLEKRMLTHIEIGRLIGEKLPLGPGYGMLIAGLRYLSLAVCFSKELAGYKIYKKYLDENGLAFNLSEEKIRWQLSHLQITSVLAIAAGFGIQIADIFASYSHGEFPKDKKFKVWIHAMQLMEWVYKDGSAEFPFEQKEYGQDKEGWNDIRKASKKILGRESKFDWINKRKEDYDPKMD